METRYNKNKMLLIEKHFNTELKKFIVDNNYRLGKKAKNQVMTFASRWFYKGLFYHEDKLVIRAYYKGYYVGYSRATRKQKKVKI